MFHWCPRYAKNAYSVIRDGEHGFLSHAHFYRGKIDEFRLEKVLDRKFKYWKVYLSFLMQVCVMCIYSTISSYAGVQYIFVRQNFGKAFLTI